MCWLLTVDQASLFCFDDTKIVTNKKKKINLQAEWVLQNTCFCVMKFQMIGDHLTLRNLDFYVKLQRQKEDGESDKITDTMDLA